MDLLLLLLVPIIIGLVGLIFGNGDITWKEFLLQEVIIIILITTSFYISAHMRIADKEIWNGVIVSKEKTRTGCCHSYPCNCREVCSGSDSSRSCSTICDTCYQHSHDEKYEAKTNNGETAYYNSCNSPGSPEPSRYTQILVGEPTSIEHSYDNYIKGNSDTILIREEINKEFNIPEYPKVYDYYHADRFFVNGKIDKHLNSQLDVLNARLGPKKQVNIIVIVVNESDQLYFEKLRQDWLGGKKNDFIVVIGVNGEKILWSNVLSWSDSEDAKVFTKNRILGLGEFDGVKVLDIIAEEVDGKFKRKSMEDFEYLKARIEPTEKAKIIIWIIGILSSIGLTILFKKEEIL